MYLLQVNVIWLQELPPFFFSSPRQISLNVTLSAQGAKGRLEKCPWPSTCILFLLKQPKILSAFWALKIHH